MSTCECWKAVRRMKPSLSQGTMRGKLCSLLVLAASWKGAHALLFFNPFGPWGWLGPPTPSPVPEPEPSPTPEPNPIDDACARELSMLSLNVYVTEDLDYGVCPGETNAILVDGAPAVELDALPNGEMTEFFNLEHGNTTCTDEGNCCVLEVVMGPYEGDLSATEDANEMAVLFRGPECRNFALSGIVLTSTSGMVKMFNYSTSGTEFRLRDMELLSCDTQNRVGEIKRATFCTYL